MSENQTDPPPVGIYAAMAAVMHDLTAVAKRDRNTHQNFVFRGIDAVVNAVGPVLREHKVIVAPNVERVEYEQVVTTGGKASTACRVLVTYSFYATDGSSLDCRVAAEAWDSGDKAAPKAMSVAFRTALLQALALPTDEPDPDSQTYERDAPIHGRPQESSRAQQFAQAEQDLAGPMHDNTRKRMFVLFNECGIPEEAQLAGINDITGKSYESRGALTQSDAQLVISVLLAKRDAIRQAQS